MNNIIFIYAISALLVAHALQELGGFMKEVTIDNVRERIAQIEENQAELEKEGFDLSMYAGFELACLRQLLESLERIAELEENDREQMAELYRRNATIHQLQQQVAPVMPPQYGHLHTSPYQTHGSATYNSAQQFEALATSKPQREAYEIIKFGTFKATEIFTDDKREFRFSEFELNCNEQITSMRNVSVKKTLQAVINALQEYCDSIDDEKFTAVLNSNVREANNDTENLG